MTNSKRRLSFRDNYPALILIVAALFIGQFSFGQYDSTKVLQQINAYGFNYPNIKIRGAALLPSDTIKLKVSDSGALVIKNNRLYTWTGYWWRDPVENMAGIVYGTGSPEAVVSAPVGTIYRRTDGSANATLYVKESGASTTGWAAMGEGGNPNTLVFDVMIPGAGTEADKKTIDTTTYITPLYKFNKTRDSIRAEIAAIPPATGKKIINVGDGNVISVLTTDSAKLKSLKQGAGINITTTDSTILFSAPTTGAEINSDPFTLTASGTRAVLSAKMIDYILVKPVSDLNAFMVGTSTNASAFVYSTKMIGGEWNSVSISSYIAANTTLYFSGITSSTEFKIITNPLHE